jgi:hypothetical protein
MNNKRKMKKKKTNSFDRLSLEKRVEGVWGTLLLQGFLGSCFRRICFICSATQSLQGQYSLGQGGPDTT